MVNLLHLKRGIAFVATLGVLTLSACGGGAASDTGTVVGASYPNVTAKFGSQIDLNSLANYANQTRPSYITKDNGTGADAVTNAGATLGRVLFYDKELSTNRTVSCASCHQQALAFGDNNILSSGVNGTTGRHSMRLINARFSNETKFFWDERAASLAIQTTSPIKDHNEMGFSGATSGTDFSNLIARLSALPYYQELFTFVYGNSTITEAKIQNALSQFVRSIQSFDSAYDVGRAAAGSDAANFSNFTASQNAGKTLFTAAPIFTGNTRTGGGLGCNGCHRAPEFDIDPNSKNNGIIGSSNGGIDITNTRAPTLRDLLKADGTPNGPMMHTGGIATLQAVIGHYGGGINIATGNTNLDPRLLAPNGAAQRLQLTSGEVNDLIAFLKTLTGTAVYTDARWSDPFQP